jgi:hypothetical protein
MLARGARANGRRAPPADPRVLIGLTEIAGYACNLRAGFTQLGVRADLLDLQPISFRFSDDTPPTRLMCRLQRVSRARLAAPAGSVTRRVYAGAQIVLLPLALAQALRRYNTFIFLYDTSFLRQRELPLLRLLRKRIVYVFCGSDDRPTYLDGGIMAPARGVTIDACIANVRAKKRMLRRVERHADVVISGPLRGLLHERPFVSFQMVGIPRLVDGETPPVDAVGLPKIVHAPSNPAAKGTEIIRATIERIRDRGYEFEFVELRETPNEVVRTHLRECAFVVDQVWSDTPMDGFVADAALYGKPAVVSGYGWDEHQSLLRDDVFPPSERCSPDGLEDAIVRLLADEEHRRALGARAQAFVAERWNAAAVAGRVLDLLDRPPPPEWVQEPSELRYLLGWGQPAERSLELVRLIVERAGAKALGLSDKPGVEQALLELAFGAGDREAALAGSGTDVRTTATAPEAC